MALHIMSFTVSASEIRARTIDVTRRMGFEDVQAMDKIQAMYGDKQIAVLLVKFSAREPLNALVEHYEQWECDRMGFADLTPEKYIRMFRVANRCKPHDLVTRIQFEYLDPTGCARQARTTINPAQAWPFPTVKT